MWLIQILSENVSHVVAFALAAHNSNMPMFAYDFNAAFSVPKAFRTKPEDES